jgi:hypothetical protein
MTEMISGVENADDPIAPVRRMPWMSSWWASWWSGRGLTARALKRIPADGQAPVVHDALCHCVTFATSGEHEMPQNAIKSCGQTAVKRS